ncbi:1509_t:CDS:2 [Paraglomus occultum]|uniref:Dihydrolipoamide acetyltransferase component of pyruvate dehydrogenase complex n=1 Tax=Paraglomus occultum TaxID=144539 RepID=A0A9N8ZAR1_9GLOM|nr:1509_t:CDS:2 [Paraglomus occultum]
MFIRIAGQILRTGCRNRPLSGAAATKTWIRSNRNSIPSQIAVREFHATEARDVVKSFLLADVGEGITECEVVQWFVEPGSRVSEFEKICEVQSDKASVEITSRYTGTVKKLHYKVGDMAKVGLPIADIELEEEVGLTEVEEADPEIGREGSPTEPLSASLDQDSVVEDVLTVKALKEIAPENKDVASVLTLATPAVRRLAREHQIDLRLIKGSGKAGRIMKEDVTVFVRKRSDEGIAEPTSFSPISSTAMTDTLNPLSKIQSSMFKAMTKSLAIPHFGYSDEYILDSVFAFRDSLNAEISRHKEKYAFSKITFMPIFIKSFSMALEEFPILNSSVVVVDENETIIGGSEDAIRDRTDVGRVRLRYRSEHNVGIAMDTPNGLIVPNIKSVQRKSIFEIAGELHRLQDLGKRNAIPVSDFKDGTITLSNVGIIGGTYLSPVVVSGEVCISAIGRIQRVPRFEMIEEQGRLVEKIAGKRIARVSFSADHRVIFGATIARFSQSWKNLLENPLVLAARLR